MRLVLFPFMGPWWVRLALAVATFALSLQVWSEDHAALADRRALAARPAPAVIPIAEVRPNPALPVQEVHLRAVLAMDPSARITDQDRKGLDERLFYVLQDESALPDDPMVRAIILLKPQDEARFLDEIRAHTIGQGAAGPIVELAGTLSRFGNAQGIGDLFRKTGMKAAETYVQISPFLAPRAEALNQLPAVDRQQPMLLVMLAGLFALAGLAQRGKSSVPRGPGRAALRKLWAKGNLPRTMTLADAKLAFRPQMAVMKARYETLRPRLIALQQRLASVRLKTPGETAISLGQALSRRVKAFDLHLTTPALAGMTPAGSAKMPLKLTRQMESAAATLRSLTRSPVEEKAVDQPDLWHRIDRERRRQKR